MQFIKRMLICFLMLIVAVFAGYLLLVLVYCIPVEKMQQNLSNSCSVLREEGTYHKVLWNANSRLDNYSDSLMLMAAAADTENVWTDALMIAITSYGGLMPDEALVSIYGDGVTDYGVFTYARYWHGYLVYLKPLLWAFDYIHIRHMLLAFQCVLMILVIYQCKKYDKRLILPIMGVWLFLNPFATTKSIMFNNVTSVTFFMLFLFLLLKRKSSDNLILKWDLLFMLCGCLTSYTDLFSFPFVTWGVLIAFFIFTDQETDYRKSLVKDIELSVLWCMGYGGMWVSKWIIGYLITGNNILDDAMGQAQHWTQGSSGRLGTYLNTLYMNIRASVQVTVVIYVVVILYLIIRLLRRRKYDIRQYICYLLIIVAPFVWYFTMINHSLLHFWFTYRDMSVCVLSLHLILLKMKETDIAEECEVNDTGQTYHAG